MSSPQRYNAAHDLIERNLAAGRGPSTAFIDDAGFDAAQKRGREVDRVVEAEQQPLFRLETKCGKPVAEAIDPLR